MNVIRIKVEEDDPGAEDVVCHSVVGELDTLSTVTKASHTPSHCTSSTTDPRTRDGFQKYEIEIEYEGPAKVSIKSEPDHITANTDSNLECSPDFDIDISHPNIKKECLESTQIINENTNHNNTDGLLEPRKSASNPKKSLHTCAECDYKTGQRSAMVRHALIHSGIKPYSCSVCDYTCRETTTYKRHLLIHSGDKPFACSECDYTCRHASSLKHHSLIHSGKNPYSCSQCDYSCRRAGHLKEHELTHSDEKPFSCDKCDYTCKQAAKLKRHVAIHSEEKPYACSECSYTCRQAELLKSHVLVHSAATRFSCNLCDYTCRHSNSLKRHSYSHS